MSRWAWRIRPIASTVRTEPTWAPAIMPLPAKMNEFERLEQFAKLQKPPE